MTNKLMQKMVAGSSNKFKSAIKQSEVYGNKEVVDTGIPMMNIALSGRFDGGIHPGLLQIAGPSKHFKTGFGLALGAAYQRKYDDGVIIFYDSEFGAPEHYFINMKVDQDRVIHTPVTNAEGLKLDMVEDFEKVEKGDHVFALIDSVGNIASEKELEDAKDRKTTVDMTRAKAMKSLGRTITPYLNTRNIPMVAINHTYKELGMYPKDIVSGGTGLYLSANDVWIMGRQQDKDGDDIVGYKFIINIDKSRFVREKSKIPIVVTYNGGIEKYSGLFDAAMKTGHLYSEKKGWYRIKGQPNNFRRSDLEYKADFWEDMLKLDDFTETVEDMYKL